MSDLKARNAAARAERHDYLEASADVNALAYELALTHVDTTIDNAEEITQLGKAYVLDTLAEMDTLFTPPDTFSKVERLLSAQGCDDWLDATLRERLALVEEYLEHYLAPKIRELVPIVLHHQRRQVSFIMAEIARENREEARRAAAAESAEETPDETDNGAAD